MSFTGAPAGAACSAGNTGRARRTAPRGRGAGARRGGAAPRAGSPRPRGARPARAANASRRRWSGAVTAHSRALALEPGVFTLRSPRAVAASLKRSADASRARKAGAYQSAMSMLNFYLNRAGSNLSAERRRVLERARDELRALYGRPRRRPAR